MHDRLESQLFLEYKEGLRKLELHKADGLGIHPETLPAHVEAILPNHSVVVPTHTAARADRGGCT